MSALCQSGHYDRSELKVRMGYYVQKKPHILGFSQSFALHLSGILHQQNTKTNIINGSEELRLSVAIHDRTGSSTGRGHSIYGCEIPSDNLCFMLLFEITFSIAPLNNVVGSLLIEKDSGFNTITQKADVPIYVRSYPLRTNMQNIF